MWIGADKSADRAVVDPAVNVDEILELFDMFMTGIASVGIGGGVESPAFALHHDLFAKGQVDKSLMHLWYTFIMSKKDSLQKEFERLMEKLRFIHNLLLALFSGLGGIIFGLAIEKVPATFKVYVILFAIVLLIVFFFTLKNSILKEQELIIKKLEKEE